MRESLAELIGTFTLVFIGAGAGALAAKSGGGLLGVALAHGLALTLIAYAWGPISGAHVNPAVTFGLLLTGKIDPAKAVMYWVAQCIGSLGAAFLLSWLLAGLTHNGQPLGLGETIGDLTKDQPAKTIVVEAVLTAFLMFHVFGSAVSGRNGNAFGLAIGLTLTADIIMGGQLTGASMNPARTLGPAIATGNTWYLWLYIVGPLLGALVAALVYNSLFLADQAADKK